ncbi:hypothetical protein K438DRAFT_1762317 [Mycena galopus ATCC 62051]|nr:hypothetical protein K438DRAFT_1762317 [Mycena galopus ATCC 62051]
MNLPKGSFAKGFGQALLQCYFELQEGLQREGRRYATKGQLINSSLSAGYMAFFVALFPWNTARKAGVTYVGVPSPRSISTYSPNSAHKVVGAWPRRVTDETARLQNIGGRRILGYRHLKGDARRKERPNYVGFQKDLILLISHRSGEASSRKSDPVNEGGRNNEPRIRGTIKIIPQPVKMHKSEDECKTPPPKKVGWYSTSGTPRGR